MSDQPTRPKTLVIRLTEKEREQIKKVTGEEVTELPIGTMESCGRTMDRRGREEGSEDLRE